MPNVEYAPPWLEARVEQTMPFGIWQGLTDHGRHICRAAVCPEGVWPAGAGVMHPLQTERQRATGGNPERPT